MDEQAAAVLDWMLQKLEKWLRIVQYNNKLRVPDISNKHYLWEECSENNYLNRSNKKGPVRG